MPKIQVIATPIGHKDDFSPRALHCLQEADIIAAEDTRKALNLLKHFQISGKTLISYHDHNEKQRSHQLLGRIIDEDLTLALISDAGTPCISDPGYRLLREAHLRDICVEPIPGACAMAALISVSGLPSDRFTFVGFFQNIASDLTTWKGSVIFYESTKRLVKTLEALMFHHPHAEICIGRELTKTHEDILHASLKDALTWAKEHKNLKGEVCAMIYCPEQQTPEEELKERLSFEAKLLFSRGATHKDLTIVMADRGLEKKELYQFLLEVQKQK
ncbi:MAG: 16S rRNA (cytidine(1402)-2'-O)-methyltransferase [Oligoflexales bacterium]